MHRIVLLCAALEVVAAASSFRVSNTLGSHMVLQRDRPSVVWGFADPGVVVTTHFKGQGYNATTDSTGVWRQHLPTQPATTQPATIGFESSDGGRTKLTDVLFGDVHICSGQSNMQFTLRSNAGVPNLTQEVALAAHYPLLRLFTVGQGTSSTTPLQQLKTIQFGWNVSSPEVVGGAGWQEFSAVCWFTFRDVFDQLGGKVPFGLISNNWGGTPIEHWSSPSAIAKCSATKKDSTLYNAMIHPYLVGPMAIRTAIWYQGEANVGAAGYYACQQPAMVADWRRSFNTNFTFGFVVIAPCDCYQGNFNAADLRNAQLATVGAIPKVAFSVVTDGVYPYSSPGDIHPVNKQLTGSRLAAQLLAVEYGMPSAKAVIPTFHNQSARGPVVEVLLEGCNGGCRTINATRPSQVHPNHTATFSIQTDDINNTWWPAKATVTQDGNGYYIEPESGCIIGNAIATSYGRADYPLNVAVNAYDMPVAPWCFFMNGSACYDRLEDTTPLLHLDQAHYSDLSASARESRAI
eukprot:Hpha_TRINITY_DN34483_c0_g1::TRINITY_DN34483_c0_g1_i1::g.96121::m.96121/K05970/SIAE; sialate O-acetylesterase